jgi:hypothetical protein
MNSHREPDDAPALIDGKLERAKEAALGPHDGDPTVADLVGEAAGGISGVLAGAAIGSLVGPIGTVIGGIAGAVGGWWGGRAISEAVEKLTEDDETYYRQHYQRRETAGRRKADHGYDEARPAYQLGHIAGMNPEYKGRRFEEIEADLQRGWNDDVRTRIGEWDAVRGYIEEGFKRRTERVDSGGDRQTDGSSASSGRSIPRGTDESPRP